MSISRRAALRGAGSALIASAAGFRLRPAWSQPSTPSIDAIHSQVLQVVKKTLQDSAVPGVLGIGPVKLSLADHRADCELHLQDPRTSYPEIPPVEVGGESITIRINPGEEILVDRKLFAARYPTYYLPGRLRGGDACQNTAFRQGGTIALTGNFRIQQMEFQEACLSCNHVLFNNVSRTIESPRYGVCMDLDWAHPVPYAGKWIDVAVARLRDSNIDVPRRVWALSYVTGVKQPAYGDRAFKYGSGTGLTSGRDRGLVWRAVDPYDPNTLYLVRTITGWFSDVGDSGAAVLDKDRNLLGIVLGGIPNIPGERWYVAALPEHESPVDPELSAFTIFLHQT